MTFELSTVYPSIIKEKYLKVKVYSFLVGIIGRYLEF